MYQDRIVLSSRDILEKEFKIDTRGYRPQEVDRYLDIIIKDYEEMKSIINDLERDKKELLEDNIRLKQEVRNLRTKIEVLTENNNEGNSTNADVLRRLSNLEKYIYTFNIKKFSEINTYKIFFSLVFVKNFFILILSIKVKSSLLKFFKNIEQNKNILFIYDITESKGNSFLEVFF